jgi:hypothetical protein
MFQLDPTLSFKTALNQQFNIVPKTKSLRHIKDTLSPLLQCHLDEFVKTFYELNSMASNHYKTKELQILWSQFLSLEATILLFSHLDNHIKNKDLSTFVIKEQFASHYCFTHIYIQFFDYYFNIHTHCLIIIC